MNNLKVKLLFPAVVALSASGCINIAPSKEPIRFEGNFTIKHEIVIKIQKDVEEVLAEDDLF